jgi:tetratricopeptide (TPR) repeat protein
LYIHGITAFFAGDLDQAITQYDRLVKLRPNDWLPIELHSFIAYWKGDYKLARTQADRSIALDPEANFPYLLRIALDLHAGELEDAAKQATIVTKKFPDPNAGDRVLSAFFGDKRNASIAALTAVGNLLLGRFNDVVRETEELAQAGNAPADLYLARGLALCARQQYKEAEQSYSSGIAADPSFTLLYLLRAESRLKQQNVAGATEDVGAIQQSNHAATLAPYIKAAQTGQFSCQTLLGAAP